jgi:hypothetical protein
MQMNENKNSFDVFLDTINARDESINIMIGTNNLYENDFYRFSENNFYFLHIDSNQPQTSTAYQQSKMFSINYQDIKHRFNEMKKHSVNEIHFDTGVSYFAPIDYLKIAQHVLVPGGKITWDLADHGSCAIYYSSKHDEFYDSRDGSLMTHKHVNDDLSKYDVMIVQSEKGDNVIVPQNEQYFENNKINPQMAISILDRDLKHKRFKRERLLGFLDYCSITYPELHFEQKQYTHANNVYPSPIRIMKIEQEKNNMHSSDFMINVYNSSVNFIVNYVMNFEERQHYVTTKKISIEKLIQLNDRIYTCVDTRNKMIEHHVLPGLTLRNCTNDSHENEQTKYNYDTMKLISMEYFHNVFFNTQYEFIVATKKH